MGHKICFFRTKFDSAHKLLLENKILPAELQVAKTSLNRFFDIVQQTNIQDQKNSEKSETLKLKLMIVHMIFLSQQNVNQNGAKFQLQETLFGNGINFREL